MRKELRGYILPVVEEALKELDYKRRAMAGPFSTEWKKGGLHVALTERRNSVVVQIHKDPPYPLSGWRRFTGEDIEDELKLIIKTYKRRRVVITLHAHLP